MPRPVYQEVRLKVLQLYLRILLCLRTTTRTLYKAFTHKVIDIVNIEDGLLYIYCIFPLKRSIVPVDFLHALPRSTDNAISKISSNVSGLFRNRSRATLAISCLHYCRIQLHGHQCSTTSYHNIFSSTITQRDYSGTTSLDTHAQG